MPIENVRPAQMERDVAAVVDIGAGEPPPAVIAASISSATAPATAAIGVTKRRRGTARPPPPSGARPCPAALGRRRRVRAQQRQFGAELVEDRREPSPSRGIGRFDCARSPKASMMRSIGPSWKCSDRRRGVAAAAALSCLAPRAPGESALPRRWRRSFRPLACCATTSRAAALRRHGRRAPRNRRGAA